MLKIVKQEAEYSSLNFHLLLSDRFDSVKTGHILKDPQMPFLYSFSKGFRVLFMLLIMSASGLTMLESEQKNGPSQGDLFSAVRSKEQMGLACECKCGL